MDYFALEPEVAGELGEHTEMDTSVHPPLVTRLHYEIGYGWGGDELLESFPCYIVTETLANRLTNAGLTGFQLLDVEVTFDEDAAEEHAGEAVPRFRWLVVTGRPGTEDLGITDKAQIVVSAKALDVLRTGRLDRCDVEQFAA